MRCIFSVVLLRLLTVTELKENRKKVFDNIRQDAISQNFQNCTHLDRIHNQRKTMALLKNVLIPKNK